MFDNDSTCKMSLESLRSFVGEVSTNLTVVRDIEAMQLVQPVGDGLAYQERTYSLIFFALLSVIDD